MHQHKTDFWAILVVLTAFFWSCKPKDNGVVCTMEARAGLNITVVDASNGKKLMDSIQVVAMDGVYTETLSAFDRNNPIFSGAYEREGNYTVVVSGARYKTVTKAGLNVTKDECHVIPQQVTIDLPTK